MFSRSGKRKVGKNAQPLSQRYPVLLLPTLGPNTQDFICQRKCVEDGSSTNGLIRMRLGSGDARCAQITGTLQRPNKFYAELTTRSCDPFDLGGKPARLYVNSAKLLDRSANGSGNA